MAAELPLVLQSCAWADRLRVAVQAVTSAGAGLLELRGKELRAEELGSQLKTSIDLAAEGWVLGLIRGTFPHDRFLAEEQYAARTEWQGGAEPFWTVDALDGTRSYVEGYAGFCVQVAYVQDARPVFGVICEPVAGRCYVAARGSGAYLLQRETPAGAALTRQLAARNASGWPARPRFVDSTPPGGVVGAMFAARRGQFVECGSIGLKACRVAADDADVYAKAFRFRLWDVAPADVLARETGCELRLWSGAAIDYSSGQVEFSNLVVAPRALMQLLLPELKAA